MHKIKITSSKLATSEGAVTYRIIEDVNVPIYLTDLVGFRVPQRSTRQSSETWLEPPPVNSTMTK